MADIEIDLDVKCATCHAGLSYNVSQVYGNWVVSVDLCVVCLQKAVEKGVV